MSKSNAQRAARAHSKASGAPYASCKRWAEQGFLSNQKPLTVEPPHLHTEVAKLCSNATGTPLRDCLTWAEQGFLSKQQPVPDGASERQRSLEAFIVNVLANGLQDSQLDSVALGIVRVDPHPAQPVLYLQPEMANTVVRELLPRYNFEYGGILGVPGLRPAEDRGDELLLQQLGGASVLLRNTDPQWRRKYPKDTAQCYATWRIRPDHAHPGENSKNEFWWSLDSKKSQQWRSHRDQLLSRLLRRPVPLNVMGREHHWVNTYTHSYLDIVFEWCCGTRTEIVVEGLFRSGIISPTPDLGLEWGLNPDSIKLGEAWANFRCLGQCQSTHPDTDKITAEIRARHAR